MTAAARRLRQREELLAMTERLVAEYAGMVPAGSVMRTVARCHVDARRSGGLRDDVVGVVEQVARARLAAIMPAHAVS